MYDVRCKAMRNMLREFIEQDISQLSLHLTNKVIPLNCIKQRWKGFRKGMCGQTVQHSPRILNHEEKETTLDTDDHKHPIFLMNNKIPEVGSGGKNIFPKYLKGV